VFKLGNLAPAGRIWWIGRQVSKHLGSEQSRVTRYNMAICFESGVIYPLALLPAFVINLSDTSLVFVDLTPVLIQIVGIAPTLIVVRIALGISIENVHDI
ncbi:hypothetical protein K435DRAFT_611598, partial [Dendrothele bispora CBS 962.96]